MEHSTFYTLDPEMKIVEVGGDWDDFADANDGLELGLDDIGGRSIYDFVDGDMTRVWLDALIQLAKLRQEPVERPYRCDSPRIRRYMQMRITPRKEGGFRIDHDLISEEIRPALVELQHARRHLKGVTDFRCSVCGRVQHEEGWIEPDQIRRDGDVYLTVVYAVCEDCQSLQPGD